MKSHWCNGSGSIGDDRPPRSFIPGQPTSYSNLAYWGHVYQDPQTAAIHVLVELSRTREWQQQRGLNQKTRRRRYKVRFKSDTATPHTLIDPACSNHTLSPPSLLLAEQVH